MLQNLILLYKYIPKMGAGEVIRKSVVLKEKNGQLEIYNLKPVIMLLTNSWY